MKELIKFFKRVFFFLLRNLVVFFQATNGKRIILVQESFSGSNTFALHKLFSNEFKSKNDVVLYKNIHNLSIFDYIKKMYFLASAKIILTTHASYKLKKSQIHFQLWHAMMIKKTGAMVLKPNENF